MDARKSKPERFWEILPLLQQVLVKVGIHRTRTGSELGLTNLQLGILGTVIHNEGCTMREVAQEHSIVPSAATRLVDELVTRELIERMTNGHDRRVVRLKVAPRGREIIDRVHEEAFPLLAQILGRMSPDDQDALITGLDALIRAVGEAEMEMGDAAMEDQKES